MVLFLNSCFQALRMPTVRSTTRTSSRSSWRRRNKFLVPFFQPLSLFGADSPGKLDSPFRWIAPSFVPSFSLSIIINADQYFILWFVSLQFSYCSRYLPTRAPTPFLQVPVPLSVCTNWHTSTHKNNTTRHTIKWKTIYTFFKIKSNFSWRCFWLRKITAFWLSRILLVIWKT